MLKPSMATLLAMVLALPPGGGSTPTGDQQSVGRLQQAGTDVAL